MPHRNWLAARRIGCCKLLVRAYSIESESPVLNVTEAGELARDGWRCVYSGLHVRASTHCTSTLFRLFHDRARMPAKTPHPTIFGHVVPPVLAFVLAQRLRTNSLLVRCFFLAAGFVASVNSSAAAVRTEALRGRRRGWCGFSGRCRRRCERFCAVWRVGFGSNRKQYIERIGLFRRIRRIDSTEVVHSRSASWVTNPTLTARIVASYIPHKLDDLQV